MQRKFDILYGEMYFYKNTDYLFFNHFLISWDMKRVRINITDENNNNNNSN